MAKDFWDYNERDNYNENSVRDDYNQVSEAAVSSEGVNSFMAGVFGWMFLGLLLSAAAGAAFIFGVFNSEAVQRVALSPAFLISLMVAELVAVFSISFGLNKISAGMARMLFAVYAILNGITLSFVCFAYAGGSVALAFVMTAAFFGVLALYGYTTKADLTKFGPILMAGLISLLIASIANFFLKSPMMDYIICLAGLGIFAGLTAYDVKKIKSVFYSAARAGGNEMAAKLSIIGALTLYLDFVNMFLYLIRLMGKKK